MNAKPLAKAAILAALAALAMLSGADGARAASPEAGGLLLEANCARCHATRSTGASPLERAPPMRTLARKYPLEHLSEALAEGIMTGHPGMPQFTFTPSQIDDILAYLQQIADP